VKAIIVRNLPPKVARAVRDRAKQDRISLGGAVIRLLEERIGSPVPNSSRMRDHDLDFVCGTWTREEADEFDKSLAAQRTIDPHLWQ
jgi:hypothetical protein